MKFRLVTTAAFLSLIIGTTAGALDVVTHHKHPVFFCVWLLAVLAEAILFPWFGALLARR